MRYAVREAFAAFRRAPLLTTLAAAMIGLSLYAGGLFGVVAYNIRRALARVEARVEIVAYLHDDADAGAVDVMRRDVAAFPEVSEVDYVSREQALETARRELGDLSPVFSQLDENPLPASLEVRLRPGQRDAEAVRAVARRIAAYPAIEDVRFGDDWLDRIFLLRRIAAVATIVLGGAFAATAVLLIGAAVRMAIFARGEEIAIMRLVGATEAFVSRPFLVEGLLTGALGGLLALGLTFLSYRVLSGAVFALDWIPPSWAAGGVAAGALLGVFASGFAVRRHLRAR